MDVGFAGPGLVVDGFDDDAGFGDVVETADGGLVVADVLGSDESGAAGDGVFGGTRLQAIMGAVEHERRWSTSGGGARAAVEHERRWSTSGGGARAAAEHERRRSMSGGGA